MGKIPRTPLEHRQHWTTRFPDISYGTCACGCGAPTNLAPQTQSRFAWVAGCPLFYVKGHKQRAGGLVLLVCLECQNTFEAKYSQRDTRKFCSRECKGKNDPRGERHHNYKGGLYVDLKGYRRFARDGVIIPEHRHIMEMHLGRRLESHEIVHHRDEDPSNNAIENLQLVTRAEHARIHDTLREYNESRKRH